MRTALDCHVHTDEQGVSTLQCDTTTDEHGVTTLHVDVYHEESEESNAQKAVGAIQDGATTQTGGLAEIEAIQAANKKA